MDTEPKMFLNESNPSTLWGGTKENLPSDLISIMTGEYTKQGEIALDTLKSTYNKLTPKTNNKEVTFDIPKNSTPPINLTNTPSILQKEKTNESSGNNKTIMWIVLIILIIFILIMIIYFFVIRKSKSQFIDKKRLNYDDYQNKNTHL